MFCRPTATKRPTPEETESGLFTPQAFEEDTQRGVVTCPAGQTSKERYHDRQKQTTKYRFEAAVCRACPLLARDVPWIHRW